MTTQFQTAACTSMNSSIGLAPLAGPRSPFDAIVDYTTRLFSVVSVWNDRARQRHQLGLLDDHLLADIGVSRAAAVHEAAKQPWQA